MDRVAFYSSIVLAYAAFIWDAYAQAKGIPYVYSNELKIVILSGFTTPTYIAGRQAIKKLIEKKKEEGS